MSQAPAATADVPLRRVRSHSPGSEDGGEGWPKGPWSKAVRIPNEGSTARDFLARERNFLSWIKLSLYLIAIFSALILRFQLGQEAYSDKPKFLLNADTPLGVLFFIAALASVSIGTSAYFGVTAAYFQRKGFAYAGKVVDAVMVGTGLLIIVTCILLLIAD